MTFRRFLGYRAGTTRFPNKNNENVKSLRNVKDSADQSLFCPIPRRSSQTNQFSTHRSDLRLQSSLGLCSGALCVLDSLSTSNETVCGCCAIARKSFRALFGRRRSFGSSTREIFEICQFFALISVRATQKVIFGFVFIQNHFFFAELTQIGCAIGPQGSKPFKFQCQHSWVLLELRSHSNQFPTPPATSDRVRTGSPFKFPVQAVFASPPALCQLQTSSQTPLILRQLHHEPRHRILLCQVHSLPLQLHFLRKLPANPP